MAWPTGNVSLANVDAGSDSISSARADIYTAFTKLNEIITSGPGTGNVTVYNDDNVAAYLPNHTGNLKANVITTLGGIFWSNGTPYSTGGGGSYNDADVYNYLPTHQGNISANNLTLTGNVYSAGGGPLITGRVTPITNKVVLSGGVSLDSAGTDLISFTLPSSGSWQITYVVRGKLPDTNNQQRAITAWISDNSNTVVDNSQLLVYDDTQTQFFSGSPYWEATATGIINITTGSSATYKLRAASSYSAGSAESDGSGYTSVTYTQLDPAFSVSNVAYTDNLSNSGNVTVSGNVTATNFNGNLNSTGTSTFGPYIERVYSIGNTSTSTITPTMINGPVQKMTATGNFTLAAPTGMSSGSSITFIIRQDATGSRTCSFNSSYKFAGGSKTLSTTANSIDIVTVFYDGTDYLCNLIKAYS